MLEITQSVGTFYVGKINSKILINIAKPNRRKDNFGIQRELSQKRVREIAKYCEDPDAAFPTPIILAINEKDIISMKNSTFSGDLYSLEFDDNFEFAEILDGQHRVEGIKNANHFECELMIVVIFDLTEEEKAYIFSTINSNQTKVDKSLIYDLFELSKERSPYKTCHEIARIMNSDSSSPFFNKLKMLGKRGSKTEVLSQGTFVTYLSRLITKTPQQDMIDIKKGLHLEDDQKLILRKYFIKEKDDIILKVMMNYFKAVATEFEKEWNDSDTYILAKTTGYGALIQVFETLFNKGAEQKTLTYEFFKEEFLKIKERLIDEKFELTSDQIPSGEQGQRKLANKFIEIINSED
jgi:DGQHR domain-containing protein